MGKFSFGKMAVIKEVWTLVLVFTISSIECEAQMAVQPRIFGRIPVRPLFGPRVLPGVVHRVSIIRRPIVVVRPVYFPWRPHWPVVRPVRPPLPVLLPPTDGDGDGDGNGSGEGNKPPGNGPSSPRPPTSPPGTGNDSTIIPPMNDGNDTDGGSCGPPPPPPPPSSPVVPPNPKPPPPGPAASPQKPGSPGVAGRNLVYLAWFKNSKPAPPPK